MQSPISVLLNLAAATIFLLPRLCKCVLSTPSIDESGITHGLQSRFHPNTDRDKENINRLFDVKSWKKKSWYSDTRCYREAVKCSEIREGFSCLGATLMHSKIIGTASPIAAQRYFHFSGLPKCWTVLRELLCAVNYPPCHDFETKTKNESRVLLVSKHLCDKAWRDCRVLIENNLWPEELKLCDDGDIYTDKCNAQTFPQLQWNNTDTCMWPLVRSDFQPGRVMDVCALNCTSPWLPESDHSSIRRWLPVVVFPMLLACFFSMVTSFVSRKNYDRSLDALFWCITCYAVICVCWLLQLFGLRDKLMCLEDGSVRLQEPGNNAGLTACTTQFAFLNGSIIGCAGWLLVYCFCQYKYRFNAKGIVGVWEKWSVCHLLSWAPAIIIDVTAMVFWQVESDGVSGICFLTTTSPWWTRGLLYLPLALYLVLCWLVMVVGLLKKQLKGGLAACCEANHCAIEADNSDGENGPKKPKPLQSAIVRLISRDKKKGRDSVQSNRSETSKASSVEEKSPVIIEEATKLLSVLFLISLCFASSLALHLSEVTSVRSKKENLMEFLLCELNRTSSNSDALFYGIESQKEVKTCKLNGSPDARLLHLHILLIQFLPCALLNFYFWTCSGVLSGYKEFWLWVKKKLYCASLIKSKRASNQNGAVIRDGPGHGMELTSLKSAMISSSEDASDPEGLVTGAKYGDGLISGATAADKRDKSKRRRISRLDAGGSRVSHRRSVSGGSKTPSGNSLASTALPSELTGSGSSLSFPDLSKHPVITQQLYSKIFEKGYTHGFMQGMHTSDAAWQPMLYSQAAMHPQFFSPAPVNGAAGATSLNPGNRAQRSAAGVAQGQNAPSAALGPNFWSAGPYADWMQQYMAYMTAVGAAPSTAAPSGQAGEAEIPPEKAIKSQSKESAKCDSDNQSILKNSAGGVSVQSLEAGSSCVKNPESSSNEKSPTTSGGLLAEDKEEEEFSDEDYLEDEEDLDDSMSDSEEEERVNQELQKYKLLRECESGNGEVESQRKEFLYNNTVDDSSSDDSG